MSGISSISSIANLNLWLDGTDLSTMIITSFTFNTSSTIDLLQWNDKSSNAYQFVPIRSNDRPKVSTNGTSSVGVCFDQVSSFQLISKTQIPATSTLDFFAVLTPFSLWGPRQPLFDSADITVAETDTRFNTQIYADGNDFLRPTLAQNSNNGAAVYKGSLYIGTNAGITPNYLQKFNRTTRGFEYINVPMACNYTHSLAVFDGKIYTAGGSNPPTNQNYGGNGSFGTGFLEFWNGSDVNFRRTTLTSSFCGPMTVNRRQLYAATWNGWAGLYFNNNTITSIANTPKPQLYTLSTPNVSTLTFVTDLQVSYNTGFNNGGDLSVYNCNMLSYRGDLWIGQGCNTSYGRSLTRLNGQSGIYNSNNLNGAVNGYIGVYWGSMIIPYNNEYRMFKWNDNMYQNFGRFNNLPVNSDTAGRIWQPSGGMCTYKGLLYTMYGGSNVNHAGYDAGACNIALSNLQHGWQSNYINVFVGERGATFSNSSNFQVTTNSIRFPQCNLMIVHDGRLFMQNGYYTAGTILEYGNGTSVDQQYSTLTSAPILLQIRKSPNICQMYLNGTLVESQGVDFTYNNQYSREMWIGGAAGTMSSGQSDSGSDHFQGAIHSIAQYSSNLNTSDRQKVEGILAWTYGIQNVLPASHPYRTSSP
jgi:hypothetical protein